MHSTNEQEGKQNMSKLITTTLTVTKPLIINQHFFSCVDKGKLFLGKDVEHKWENPTVEMISHGHKSKPNTKTARKLIINGIEFVEVFPTIFRTNGIGTKRELNDLTYNYEEKDFQ